MGVPIKQGLGLCCRCGRLSQTPHAHRSSMDKQYPGRRVVSSTRLWDVKALRLHCSLASSARCVPGLGQPCGAPSALGFRLFFLGQSWVMGRRGEAPRLGPWTSPQVLCFLSGLSPPTSSLPPQLPGFLCPSV